MNDAQVYDGGTVSQTQAKLPTLYDRAKSLAVLADRLYEMVNNLHYGLFGSAPPKEAASMSDDTPVDALLELAQSTLKETEEVLALHRRRASLMSLLTRLRHQIKQKALSLPDVEALLAVVNLVMEERDLLYGWYVHMVRCEECDPPHLCPVGERRYKRLESVARKSGKLLNG